MAALSVGHYWHINKAPGHELVKNRNSHRFVILLSCKGRGPVNNNSNQGEKKDMGGKLTLLNLFNRFEKVGKRVKQNMSPQQKGDWKDLLLMSLSFAVYVYISQKLVCAYFAWTVMPNKLW